MPRIIQVGLLISISLPGRLCAQATPSPASPPTPPKYYVCSYLLNAEGASDKTKAPQTDCSAKTPRAKDSEQSHKGAGTKPTGGKQPQTINFSEIPASPLDFPFTVTAASNSNLPVTIKVESGLATATGSAAVILRGGEVKLVATQAGDTQYGPTMKELEFTALDDLDYCVPGLIPSPSPKQAGPDVNAIISALGNPVPFSFEADGHKRILVYSSRLKAHRQPTDTGLQMLTPEDRSTLAQITVAMGQLEGDANLAAGAGDSSPSSASPGPGGASSATPAYSLEVPVPHAGSFGGLVSTLNGINPDLFTVQGVGSDRIRIKSTKMPSCHEVTLFLQDVRHVAWQAYPESPVAQEYHLASASDFVSAFSGNGGQSANQSGAGNANSNTPVSSQTQLRNPNAVPSGQGSGQGGTGGPGASGGAGNASGASPTSASKASAATGGSPGSSDTNSAASVPGSQALSGADNTGTQPSSSAPPAPSNSASVNLISPDLFLFLDRTPGNDGDITEKKRILAQLDLPRPEVLINVWSMQFSTGNEEDVGKLNGMLNQVVGDYNNGLQEVVSLGFGYLKSQMVHSSYFEPNFFRYVTGRYVGERARSGYSAGTLHSGGAVTTSGSDMKQPDEVAAGMLLMGSAPSLTADMRAPNGICPADEYCLGYTTVFQPLEPSLMHLLLAIIAAQDPWFQACRAINYVETTPHVDTGGIPSDASAPAKYKDCWGRLSSKSEKTREADQETDQEAGREADSVDGQHSGSQKPTPEQEMQGMWERLRQEDCESEDLKRYNEHPISDYRPQMQLECFRQAAALLYEPSPTTEASAAGLTRSAVADFLFNYKLAQQYPHEFSPYDLTLSAQKLDTALNPFNVAFNRDVVAYQKFLRGSIDQCVRSTCPFGDKWGGFENKSFTNDAILTVRTLSATQTSAGVTTQNFLNDTQPGSLSDLLGSSVKEGQGGSGGAASSAATTVGDLLAKSPLPAQLALNALKASQSTEVQIGKSINLKVTPHSLAGASSAELDLTLNVDDAADPTFYTPTQSSNKADVSRVSNHDVSTRVRVDSLKLVDISSFSATLRRSRSRFPLLPIPGFEVPYVGSLVGIPLPAAKEYHSSTAVLSAIVVPTAADLAFGLTFVSDRIVDGEHAGNCHWVGDSSDTSPRCRLRKAESLSDLGSAPVRSFNKAMVTCLATEGWGNLTIEQVPYFAKLNRPERVNPCSSLDFNSVFLEAE